MYFIVQMSEINSGHFHSTWCCVVALRKGYFAIMAVANLHIQGNKYIDMLKLSNSVYPNQ